MVNGGTIFPQEPGSSPEIMTPRIQASVGVMFAGDALAMAIRRRARWRNSFTSGRSFSAFFIIAKFCAEGRLPSVWSKRSSMEVQAASGAEFAMRAPQSVTIAAFSCQMTDREFRDFFI